MNSAGTQKIDIKTKINDASGETVAKIVDTGISNTLSNGEVLELEIKVAASGSETITLSDVGASNTIFLFWQAERAVDMDLNGSATKGYAKSGYIGHAGSISSITFDETSGNETAVRLILGS